MPTRDPAHAPVAHARTRHPPSRNSLLASVADPAPAADLGGLILATRGRIVAVTVGTALIAVVAHIDGAGASTFLITIPALLPLYMALHMSRYLMLFLIVLSAGIFNMIPWGGPLGRAASVLDVDPIELYRPLIPMQIIALLLVVVFAVIAGILEKRRIARLEAAGELPDSTGVTVRSIADDFSAKMAEDRDALGENLRRARWIFWANLLLVIAVVSTIMSGYLPPALTFLSSVWRSRCPSTSPAPSCRWTASGRTHRRRC